MKLNDEEQKALDEITDLLSERYSAGVSWQKIGIKLTEYE